MAQNNGECCKRWLPSLTWNSWKFSGLFFSATIKSQQSSYLVICHTTFEMDLSGSLSLFNNHADIFNNCFHCFPDRWRDYLQAHGAFPGALECRKVLYDQLPPGHERQPLPALHRHVTQISLLFFLSRRPIASQGYSTILLMTS